MSQSWTVNNAEIYNTLPIKFNIEDTGDNDTENTLSEAVVRFFRSNLYKICNSYNAKRDNYLQTSKKSHVWSFSLHH